MGSKASKNTVEEVPTEYVARGSVVDVCRHGKWHSAKVKSVGTNGAVTVVFNMHGRNKEMIIDKKDRAKKIALSGTKTDPPPPPPGSPRKPSAIVKLPTFVAHKKSVTQTREAEVVTPFSLSAKGGPLERPSAAAKVPKEAIALTPGQQGVPQAVSQVPQAIDLGNSNIGPMEGEQVDYIDILDKSQPLEPFDPFGQAFLADNHVPPPPKGGWRWRPAAIEESKGNIAKVRFLDERLLRNFPGTGSVRLDDEELIAPYMTKSAVHIKHHSYEIGDVVDVLDIFRKKNSKKLGKKWRKCQIVKTENYFIRVSYVGWSKAFDEWIHVLEQVHRIAEFCSMTEQETKRRETAEKNFVKQLRKKKGLTVVPVSPDGNCLFRAVAFQVYGDPERHDVVRSDCIDYLEKNRDRFEPLLEAGEFDAYLATKRTLGVWGDDPEVRAMEELYDRPIEVYLVSGDGSCIEPLKLHFEGDLPEAALTDVLPIRLSFHGDNHYNSVITFTEDSEGADVSKEAFMPQPLRLQGVIRNHRRERVKSLRKSVKLGFQLNTHDLHDEADAESKLTS
mmetsp:Transcript_18605/g.34471  ORF Transcript_18605/g.34471 Transcript_18605/m.34471 type:complete len:560 (-) Transcript_18605:113-1792(-)